MSLAGQCGQRRSCPCAVTPGSGIMINGSGTPANPWEIMAEDPTLTGNVIYHYANLAAVAVDWPSPPTNFTVYLTDDDRITRWTGTAWTPHYGGMAIVARTANQVITSAISTPILFTAADIFDPLGWHDPAVLPDRVGPGAPGVYRVSGCVDFASTVPSATRVQVWPMLNGSVAGYPIDNTWNNSTLNPVICSPSQLLTATSATDYFGLRVHHVAGSDRSVTARMFVEFLAPL